MIEWVIDYAKYTAAWCAQCVRGEKWEILVVNTLRNHTFSICFVISYKVQR